MRRDILFREKYTEIVLSNGNSYIILGNYEEVKNKFISDSGQQNYFFQIGDSFINLAQIAEIKDYYREE